MNKNEATRLVAEQLDKAKSIEAAWLVWSPDPGSAEQVLCELESGETLSVTVEVLANRDACGRVANTREETP